MGLAAATVDELLADQDIEMVIVLTPVGAHYGLIKAALEAGKHVYTEKTLTVTSTEAEELVAIAADKGLYLGSAPDTFLGSCYETARQAIADDMLGDINSFSISICRNNDILTGMFPFLRQPGAGILRDYVVYYLTALCALLGPVEQVAAFVETQTDASVFVWHYPNESQLEASLIEQEVDDANGDDPVISAPCTHVVADHDELAERVAHLAERPVLLVHLLGSRQRVC